MSSRPSLRRPRYADVAATLALLVATSGTAYATTIADPGSVNTAALQDRAVTAPKIASEAVVNRAVAPNAITGSNVAGHSLALSDLAGASITGPISFSLTSHGCGFLNLSVPGAQVGQAAVLTWVGTANPPQGVVLGPLKVVGTGRVVASACDVTGHAITASSVRVRVVTLS